MLVDAGCSHVIIGHSERRQFFGETDETVNRKIRAALSSKLIPVFCIGESETERDAGDTFSVLDKQVRVGLKNFVSDDLAGFVIAYEPVWAIGTGKTATREQAQEAHQFIRSLLETLFGKPFASIPFASFTEGVLSRIMSVHSWRCPMWMAPWSAVPAWTPKRSASWFFLMIDLLKDDKQCPSC
jgi:hypothetical protein